MHDRLSDLEFLAAALSCAHDPIIGMCAVHAISIRASSRARHMAQHTPTSITRRRGAHRHLHASLACQQRRVIQQSIYIHLEASNKRYILDIRTVKANVPSVHPQCLRGCTRACMHACMQKSVGAIYHSYMNQLIQCKQFCVSPKSLSPSSSYISNACHSFPGVAEQSGSNILVTILALHVANISVQSPVSSPV